MTCPKSVEFLEDPKITGLHFPWLNPGDGNKKKHTKKNLNLSKLEWMDLVPYWFHLETVFLFLIRTSTRKLLTRHGSIGAPFGWLATFSCNHPIQGKWFHDVQCIMTRLLVERTLFSLGGAHFWTELWLFEECFCFFEIEKMIFPWCKTQRLFQNAGGVVWCFRVRFLCGRMIMDDTLFVCFSWFMSQMWLNVCFSPLFGVPTFQHPWNSSGVPTGWLLPVHHQLNSAKR